MTHVAKQKPTVIRQACASDLEIICINERKSYSIPWSNKSIQESIEGDHYVFLMKSHEHVIGHMIIQQILDETHLLNVCVVPEFQRKGMGKDWINFLLSFAAEHSSISLFLEVRISNHSAISLYTQSGFKTLATRKGYYRTHNGAEDGLVMELKL